MKNFDDWCSEISVENNIDYTININLDAYLMFKSDYSNLPDNEQLLLDLYEQMLKEQMSDYWQSVL